VVPLAATERFEAFGAQHYLVLLIFLAGIGAAAVWGRSHRDSDRQQRERRVFAAVLALVGISMQGYQLTPDDFALGTSLPLQLCDVATVGAVIALWSADGRAAAFTYYVGLTLTVQAVLTPSLAEPFPHPRFFGFWALHLLVIWAAVYLTWGLGIRPTWRRYGFTVAVTAAWAAAVYAFNVVAGTNYGYLNRKPPAASALDLLGPWPWYVANEVVLVCVVWALMTWPWVTGAGRTGGRGGPSPTRATPSPGVPTPGPARRPARARRPRRG
jgi:hypothetical integral membrane protein (TIGR02206 family)